MNDVIQNATSQALSHFNSNNLETRLMDMKEEEESSDTEQHNQKLTPDTKDPKDPKEHIEIVIKEKHEEQVRSRKVQILSKYKEYHIPNENDLQRMLKDALNAVPMGFLPGNFFPDVRKKFVQLFSLKYYFKLVVAERILDSLPVDERKGVFEDLWAAVTDPESLTSTIVEESLVTTNFEESQISNVAKAQLFFQLLTFILSFTTTTIVAVTTQLPVSNLTTTLGWASFGISLGSTICKSIDSGALPLISSYYKERIREVENTTANFLSQGKGNENTADGASRVENADQPVRTSLNSTKPK